ncbi:MAG: hypothetical protein H0W73_15925 [Bacteroidetes bacterium]|nr:hypothetical protein [Bacteroidota bacterium]
MTQKNAELEAEKRKSLIATRWKNNDNTIIERVSAVFAKEIGIGNWDVIVQFEPFTEKIDIASVRISVPYLTIQNLQKNYYLVE